MDAHASAVAAASRRRHAIRAVKFLLAAGILAFLLYQLRGEQVFSRLVNEPKQWGLLAAGQCLVIAGLTLNYVRWWTLVHALGLDFRVRDALRLGSLGLLLNQVSPGSVGGDLFKAVFIAREQPGKRTEAVASVIIDRVVGLYAMLLVGTAGYVLGAAQTQFHPAMHALANTVAVFAALGTIGICLLMTPGFTGPTVRSWVERLPLGGSTLARLVDAAAAYRHRRINLFAAIVMGCCTHTMLVLAFWCISHGLPVTAPSLATIFVIGPMSLAAGAIPLTPSGLGTFEAAMDQLFQAIGARRGDGLLVAITQRVMTYVMAAVGAAYYLSARRTVSDVLHEAEDLVDAQASLVS